MADVTPIRPLPRGGDLPAVAQHVLDALDGLVPRMGAAYRREVAEYAALDEADFDLVLRTSHAFVRRFVVALADGVAQPLPDHPTLVASGRRRQQLGVSLDAAMHAFRIASREGWSAIADASTAVAPRLVSELAARWIEYADRASTAFAEGHTSAMSEQLRRMDARRHALLADLLAAEDTAAARALAAGHGLRLAGGYVPVLLAGAAVPEHDLPLHLPAGALSGRRGGHLLALVPEEAQLAPAILHQLAGDGVVVVGRPCAPGAALRREVAEVTAVLRTALALGRPGVHDTEDLALHRAVAEHDGLARHLRARVLGPLVAGDPDGTLRETLRAYLDDGAIRSVADRLFVHANTVSYRLRRVHALTGLDARVPAQAASLVLALALADVDVATSDPTTSLPDHGDEVLP